MTAPNTTEAPAAPRASTAPTFCAMHAGRCAPTNRSDGEAIKAWMTAGDALRRLSGMAVGKRARSSGVFAAMLETVRRRLAHVLPPGSEAKTGWRDVCCQMIESDAPDVVDDMIDTAQDIGAGHVDATTAMEAWLQRSLFVPLDPWTRHMRWRSWISSSSPAPLWCRRATPRPGTRFFRGRSDGVDVMVGVLGPASDSTYPHPAYAVRDRWRAIGAAIAKHEPAYGDRVAAMVAEFIGDVYNCDVPLATVEAWDDLGDVMFDGPTASRLYLFSEHVLEKVEKSWAADYGEGVEEAPATPAPDPVAIDPAASIDAIARARARWGASGVVS